MINSVMDLRQSLLLTQIYAHILFVIGLFSLPLWYTIPVIIVCQIIFVGLCGTVFYHRVVTHKNPVSERMERFLLLLSWVGASGSALGWAGTHRAHHRYSDTERDPHSPQHIGVVRTYWWSSGNTNIVRFVPDLLRKPWYVFQHNHYFKVLLGLHIIGLLVLPFALYWAILITPAFLMWFAGSTVNVFGHDSNGPVNSNFWGWLHAGEGWHKNHHDNAASVDFHPRWDWGGYIYRLIAK